MMDTLLNQDWNDYETPIAYADDLAVIVKSNERMDLKRRLKQVINKITDWATQNKLLVSDTKTTFMINKSPPGSTTETWTFAYMEEKSNW